MKKHLNGHQSTSALFRFDKVFNTKLERDTETSIAYYSVSGIVCGITKVAD